MLPSPRFFLHVRTSPKTGTHGAGVAFVQASMGKEYAIYNNYINVYVSNAALRLPCRFVVVVIQFFWHFERPLTDLTLHSYACMGAGRCSVAANGTHERKREDWNTYAARVCGVFSFMEGSAQKGSSCTLQCTTVLSPRLMLEHMHALVPSSIIAKFF